MRTLLTRKHTLAPTGVKKKTVNRSEICQNSWEVDGSAQQKLATKRVKIVTIIMPYVCTRYHFKRIAYI